MPNSDFSVGIARLPEPLRDMRGVEYSDGDVLPHYAGDRYCVKMGCNAPSNAPIHDYEDPEEFGF